MSLVHLHLLVNHLPSMATVLAVLLLAIAALRLQDRGLWTAGVLLLAVAALGALVTLETGEAAEEAIEGLPGIVPALVEEHEERAPFGVAASVVAGVIAVAGWWWGRAKPLATARATVGVTLVVAALAAAILAWVGASGGLIRHPEIRPTEASTASD